MTSDPLSALEAAVGMPLGSGAPVTLPASGLEPAVALAQACLPFLQKGRCWVAFSGGRDSSLVFAAATQAARRAGFEDPIPITYRFPALPSAH